MVSFFDKIIDVFYRQKIPYMLSGSEAMSIYVISRSTRDIDFVVHLMPKDVDAFVEDFSEGYYCDKESIEDAVRKRKMFDIIDHKSSFKADFVVLKDEVFRQEELNRRGKLDYFGKEIYVVSAEDLLISKIIWARDFQFAVQCMTLGIYQKFLL
jgi:hypothetical protein